MSNLSSWLFLIQSVSQFLFYLPTFGMVFFILLSAVHYFDSIEKTKINGSKYSNCQDNSLINFSTHNRKDKIKIIYSSVFFLNHKKYLKKVILFRWKKTKNKKKQKVSIVMTRLNFFLLLKFGSWINYVQY